MGCTKARARPRNRGRRWIAVFGVLLLASCLEPPVEERLHLEITADGALQVEVSVRLRYPADGAGNERLRQRLEGLAEGWLSGLDPWALRFERLQPTSEDSYWRKEEGRLSFASRQARVDDPGQVVELFADTAVQAHFDTRSGLAELALIPGGSRATRRERRRVDVGLAEWSEAVANHLELNALLVEHLEEAPERALPLLASLFEVELPAAEPPDDAESELLEALSEAFGTTIEGVLDVARGEEDSLDGLARKVFDPFPARVTVALPVVPQEVEGFEPDSDGWLVPPLSPLAAFQRAQGRWLAPDLFWLWLDWARTGESPSLDELRGLAVELGRAEALPTAEEVEETLRQALEPAPVYRLVWALPASEPTAEEEASDPAR